MLSLGEIKNFKKAWFQLATKGVRWLKTQKLVDLTRAGSPSRAPRAASRGMAYLAALQPRALRA